MIKIAIGIGTNNNILKAIEEFEKEYQADIDLVHDDNDLANAILDDDIDAVVRGSLAASGVIKKGKENFPDISRATYVNGEGKEFLLSPVGIDEGNTVEEKFKIAKNCGEFLEKLGKEGGRTLGAYVSGQQKVKEVQ